MSKRLSKRPFLGTGIGLRTAHFDDLLARRARVDWFEALSENFMTEGGRPLHVLESVRRDYPVALHGVSLSIAGTDPLNHAYLKKLRGLIDRFRPAWISDHLCWTSADAHNLHDLLPVPYDDETLDHICKRVDDVQHRLGERIALENVSTYLAFTHSTLSEGEFLAALAERADCDLLLDVNNAYVNARNHGDDPRALIDALPAERVVQIHLAGHSDCGTHVLDTHDHPVAPAVWELYLYALERLGPVSTLIEWDGAVPPLDRLEEEADLARSAARSALEERVPGDAARNQLSRSERERRAEPA